MRLRLRRHVHEWGPWRFMLIPLTDSPFVGPAKEARHCKTCPKLEIRQVAAEGGGRP